MADDADDLALHSDQVEVEMLANGVLHGENLLLKLLIDDGDTGTLLAILRGEEAPADQGYAHDLEIVGSHSIKKGHIHLALLVGFGPAFDPIRQLGVASHRHCAHFNAGCAHARDGSQLIQGLLISITYRGGRAVYG